MSNYHALTIEQVQKEFQTSSKGLTRNEAKKRLKESGLNVLPEKRRMPLALRFFAQFANAFAIILVIAATISFVFQNRVDGWVIVGILTINAIIGFVEEYRAERAIEALKKLVVPQAKVRRQGVLRKIPASQVVPGDIITLEEGDRVPADARIIQETSLRTDEASLTGESFPVDKDTIRLKGDVALGDRVNMLFLGTLVVGGQAEAVVTATGGQTALGTIAHTVGQIKRKTTHYQKRTKRLAWVMSGIAIVGTLLIFLVGFFINKFPIIEMAMFSIASLVSGIPEGLPAVLIIVLTIGAYRMSRRKAIIRHLPSTETLSVATVIATDKTGTLTQNSMTVRKIITGSGVLINVGGTGWNPEGDFQKAGQQIKPLVKPDLKKLLQTAITSSAAKLYRTDDGPYEIIGDPTEAALVVLGEKAGFSQKQLEEEQKIINELAFNRKRKYRARLLEAEGKREIVTAGAFERILAISNHFLDEKGRSRPLTDPKKKALLEAADKMAGEALRVLGIAVKVVENKTAKLDTHTVNGLTLLGLVGMIDPPRPEVIGAIAKARRAGIRVIMKTGDHKETALAIAREIGLVDHADAIVYTENELTEMDEAAFGRAVREAPIFARVAPETKHRIVKTLQAQGEVVAVTGDGVNDAPALRQADIGIAMGRVGTDVAREASEMVLMDDNFASIVSAIEEGRTVFRNVRLTSSFIVTTNFAEMATLLGTILLGLPLPLLAIQILWMNIVSETAVGLAIAAEPKHPDILLEPPRKPKEPILSREVVPFIVLMVLIMVLGTIPLFLYALPEGLEKARAVAFTFMVWTQLWNVWNMRSLKDSVFGLGPLTNRWLVGGFVLSAILQIMVVQVPFFQEIFKFAPLSLVEWIFLIAISSVVLWFGEIYKLVRFGKTRLAQA